MKIFLSILFWLIPVSAFLQVKDSILKQPGLTVSAKNSVKGASYREYKPEILTSGFIDIVNNGQVNASARFIRLFIGEPGRFAIPLSIYSGVSSNNFQNQQAVGGQRSNEHLVSSFINPLSGLANMSIDGVIFFNRKAEKLTRAGFMYHGGIRILTGYKTGPVSEPSTGKPINFLNSFGSTGLYFQTGAWERNNSKNVGIFWLAGRYILCKTGDKQLKEIIPAIETNGVYHGWSLGWGVEINNLVNIKVLYYKYVKKPEINYSLPIYQFSFNYSLKN
ncbi:MAG: hypothetical protein IPQ25_01375 [Chitinophagaceae bacterium]|nr:hypothetical protein [Chitinophagaceae bacterium]HQV60629.1 hypothetical protein [Chitinophagaceae bacterium]HQV85447.1 hypothetical protein [Chitinophagaceae bacterium]HQX71774.1 hypothetical protein [Chitinophagaceae bacterium]HQZ74978.1 hypothetical protein [Chitinophagaceae bacterium]